MDHLRSGMNQLRRPREVQTAAMQRVRASARRRLVTAAAALPTVRHGEPAVGYRLATRAFAWAGWHAATRPILV